MIRFVKIHGGQNKKGSQDVIPDAPYHDMCYVLKKAQISLTNSPEYESIALMSYVHAKCADVIAHCPRAS